MKFEEALKRIPEYIEFIELRLLTERKEEKYYLYYSQVRNKEFMLEKFPNINDYEVILIEFTCIYTGKAYLTLKRTKNKVVKIAEKYEMFFQTSEHKKYTTAINYLVALQKEITNAINVEFIVEDYYSESFKNSDMYYFYDTFLDRLFDCEMAVINSSHGDDYSKLIDLDEVKDLISYLKSYKEEKKWQKIKL